MRFFNLRQRGYRSDGGFTLAELIVVIGIGALLASVAIPLFTSQTRASDTTVARVEARNVSIAVQSLMLQLRSVGSGISITQTAAAGSTPATINVLNPNGLPTTISAQVSMTPGVTLNNNEVANNKVNTQTDYCIALNFKDRTVYQSANGPMSSCTDGQVLTSVAAAQGYNTTNFQTAPVFLSTSLPAAAVWSGCAYGNGTFSCVENGGSRALTSPDGVSWTLRTLPSSGSWKGVTFGNGRFVAFGAGNVISTSTDGISWANQTVTPATNWTGASYGAGVWTLVSDTTYFAVSTTGTSGWTSGATGLTNTAAVTYGGGKFMAVGTGTSAAVGTISNGNVTWASVNLPGSQAWTDVTYGNGQFITTYSGGAAVSSTTGAAWTLASTTIPAGYTGVAYGNGLFFLAGPNSSTTGYTSTDGITWVARTISTTAGQWSHPAYGFNSWVVLGRTTNTGLVGV